MKVLGAFKTFVLVMIGQVFALAIIESTTRLFIAPFGSRNILLFAMLGVATVAAIVRWQMSGSASGAPLREGEARARGNASHSTTTSQHSPTTSPRAPTTSPRAAQLIDAASRQAILFRQHFPPPHDDRILSFFGGAPIASHQLAWPRDAATNAPLHFVMQIDCSAIPAKARLGALPDTGVLYFFMNLDWNEGNGHHVVHLESRGTLAALSPPAGIRPLFGKSAHYSWAWTQSDEESPVSFPKWTFEPVVIDIEPVREEGVEEESATLWSSATDLREILAAAQGPAVHLQSIGVKDVYDGRELRRPFPTYPQDWRAIQIAAAGVVKKVDEVRRYEPRLFAEMEPEAKDALLVGISSAAQSWFDRAAQQPPFDAVPQNDRDAFWTFLASQPSVTRFLSIDALTHSIEASISASAEAAARIPADFAERVRHRHALAVHTDRGIFVNTPDRMLAAPVDVQGNQEERARDHLLLLEMSSNEGLGHHFGEGVYQLWIKPDDLVARRFERVVLTSDAY
jgi:hypothetical protein